MRKNREVLLLAATGCFLILIYHLIFGQYFPNDNGKLGHDYALFLPKLLDGYFWYRSSGLFAVPWFTPAFCGGIPLLADPQSIYYSVPQFLSFATHPLSGVYLTFLLFAGLGFAGFYFLLRHAFLTTQLTAFFGAGLFLFNGFYAHRILIGHLTYHSFMLVPFITFLLLRPLPEDRKRRAWRQTFDFVTAGLLFAYTFQSGMVNVILPVVISAVIIGLIHGAMHRRVSTFWLRLTLAGFLALVLCVAKLAASGAYLRYFARDTYKLPGAQSISDAAILLFHSLFLGPAHETAEKVLVNTEWLLERHEFEFGVTFIPLLALLIGGAAMLRLLALGSWRQGRRDQWLQIGAIGVLLFLPIILNVYTPAWNEFLKQVPIIKNSTSLIRWFSIYIPVVIVLAALAVEKTPILRRYQPFVVAVGTAVVIAMNVLVDRGYYHAQGYDPDEIASAYHKSRWKDWSPVISHITVFTERTPMPVFPNGALAHGSSELLCYEPLFGYRLEYFPLKTLRRGLTMAISNGRFNLKNPACYVYPAENGCTPGDHFTIEQHREAEALISYRPFAFKIPLWQKIANLINLISVAVVTAFLISYGLVRCFWLTKRQK